MTSDARMAPWPRKPVSIAAELNPARARFEIGDDQLVDFVPMASVAVELGGINLDRARPVHEVRKGYTQFQEGDVLFAKITPCMENGKIAVVPPLRSDVGYGSTEFHVLRPRPDVHPKWLAHFLAQADFRKKAQRNMSGSAGQLRVPGKWLDEQEIPLPALDIQEQVLAKIEELFSDLDAGVAALERARARLKRYRASVLKAAVEGRLTEKWRAEQKAKGIVVEPAAKLLERILAERRKKWETAQLKKCADVGKTSPNGWKSKYSEPSTPDSGNLSELPQGWSWATTDQLFWYVTSGSRGWAQYYSEDGAAFLRIGNLDHFTIDLDLHEIRRVSPPVGAEGARTRVEKDDILISITADVGMIAHVADYMESAYINQHIALGRCSDASVASFTAWFLASSVGQKQFRSLQRGATKVGLGLDDIKAVKVPLPSIEEQTEIISKIEAALSSISHAEAEIEHSLARAARLRQAILKRAFEGRLV